MDERRYIPDPALAATVLMMEDINALLANGGKGLIGDKRALMHFLGRTKITIQVFRKQLQLLHRDVQAANLAAEPSGRGVSINPMEQAPFLTAAMKEQFFDGSMRERLAAVTGAYNEIDALRLVMHGQLNRLAFAVTGLLERPDLPPEVKEALRVVMRAAPADPGVTPSVRPAALQDFGPPAGPGTQMRPGSPIGPSAGDHRPPTGAHAGPPGQPAVSQPPSHLPPAHPGAAPAGAPQQPHLDAAHQHAAPPLSHLAALPPPAGAPTLPHRGAPAGSAHPPVHLNLSALPPPRGTPTLSARPSGPPVIAAQPHELPGPLEQAPASPLWPAP